MNYPLFISRVSLRRLLLVVLAATLAAEFSGCATGEYMYVATLAGGERRQIPLVKGAPVMAKEGGIQILQANGAVNKEMKKLGYFFAFSDQGASPPNSVTVEDVSDETAVLLVEDPAPQLKDKKWAGTSRLLAIDEKGVEWVSNVSDSFRVFRFTIMRADGNKIVLYQGSRVPAWAKAGIRAAFGEKP